MKRKNMARNALFTSVLSLLLCVSMLVGTTFAWFTDEVTSSNNIIKSGNLDVEMYWADGTMAVPADDSNEWKDASTGAIFNYDLWEPGYTEVRHIKIANEGTLALKYQVLIKANGEVSNLSDVIDVYYVDPAVQVADRTTLTNAPKLGTLTEVLAGVTTSASGELIANTSDTITLALKMREEAGNEYQDLAIGTNFSVVLLATQLTSEEDSFDNQYDVDSLYPYVAIGGVTKEDVATAVKSEDESVMIEIPAEAPEGDYVLTVTNKSEKTDAEGNTTVSMDISLLKDGVKVSDGNEYTVHVNLGAGLQLTKLMHNDKEITNYDYDMISGVVTFTTNGFSPFSFTYKDVGNIAVSGNTGYTSLADAIAAAQDGGTITLLKDIAATGTVNITKNVTINGNGCKIYRTEKSENANLFEIDDGYTLTLSNITVDGGAVWTGEVNEYLLRGTVNTGMTTTGALVTHGKKAHLVLGDGAVLQNNDGANAVFLNTREGSTLTLNGGEIINNHSAAGAIWGGGAITINSGKINGNHGGIGGAIRAVTNIGTLLTMNGGEMNHNYSDGNGGAIWAGTSRSNNVYVLNGGEMAYNYSATTGGAIYAGHYETVKIGGTFKMHDNDCAADIGSAIRFHDHATLVMTGGEIYNQGENGFYLNNNSASITGGSIKMNFGYSGGLGLTIGAADIDGIISFNLATNHNTAYLAAEFNSFEFTVNESAANFAQFNIKPASGYVYTEGDEAKLICKNEGYSTYWDAATGTFRLRAN